MMPEPSNGRAARTTYARDENAMEFGHAHAVLSAPNYAFRGLSAVERRALSGWLAAVRSAGIDAAEDLGARPWSAPVADTIIGVFKSGHLLASWLVISQNGSWAVACCADGVVSEACENLSDALAVVCKPRQAPAG